MNNIQLVSIILPIRNAESKLKACLESLLAQTYTNIEVIAIDDNSTDSSYKILRSIQRVDKRIRSYRNKKTYGLSTCLNRAFKKTKGSFVTFMGAYDTCIPERIEKQVEFLHNNPKVAAVGTQAVIINNIGEEISRTQSPLNHEDLLSGLPNGSSLQVETGMIQKTQLPKDILYADHDTYPLAYTDIYLKIAKFAKVSNLPYYLYVHTDSSIHPSSSLKLANLFSVMQFWLKSIVVHNLRPSLRSFFYLW